MKETTKKIFMEAVEEKLNFMQHFSKWEGKHDENAEKSVEYMIKSNELKRELLAMVEELASEEE